MKISKEKVKLNDNQLDKVAAGTDDLEYEEFVSYQCKDCGTTFLAGNNYTGTCWCGSSKIVLLNE